MIPQQIQDVTRTWAMVAPTADAAVALFYERLFAIDPALRAFFAGTDLPAQRRKLAAALATVLGGLDRLDALRPARRRRPALRPGRRGPAVDAGAGAGGGLD